MVRCMKSIHRISIIIILLGLTQWCTAQQVWSIYPAKKCARICITTTDSAHIAYNKAISAFLRYGYSIDGKDKDNLTFTTKPKPAKSVNTELTAYVTQTDSTRIYLYGSFTTIQIGLYANGVTANSGNLKSQIVKRGMNNSPIMNAWNELYNVAMMIEGQKSYLKP